MESDTNSRYSASELNRIVGHAVGVSRELENGPLVSENISEGASKVNFNLHDPRGNLYTYLCPTVNSEAF